MVLHEALQEAAAGSAVGAAAVAKGHTPGGVPGGSRRTSYAGHATQATTVPPPRPSISLAPPGAGAGAAAAAVGGDGRAANGMPLPTAVGLRAFVEAAQGSELLRGYVRLYKTPPAKVRIGRKWYLKMDLHVGVQEPENPDAAFSCPSTDPKLQTSTLKHC